MKQRYLFPLTLATLALADTAVSAGVLVLYCTLTALSLAATSADYAASAE